jgi:predicted N-acetyltransferase YhbS
VDELTPLEAVYGSSEYRQSIDLRRRVLRIPLGLDFTPEQLEAERVDFHLVAVRDGRVAACMVLTALSIHEVKMRQVAVEPELQGRGIGRTLVHFSEVFAREKGFSRMVLNARDTAVPFYLGLNYELEGEPFVEVSIPHRHMAKALETQG